MRQLVFAAQSKREDEWSRTAGIMCILAEINRDPKSRSKPYKPEEFNPMIKKPKRHVHINDFKAMFVSGWASRQLKTKELARG